MVYLGIYSNCFSREAVGWSKKHRESCVILLHSVTNPVLHYLMSSQVLSNMCVHAWVLWPHALRWYYLGKKKSFECHSLGHTAGDRVSAEREEQEASFPLFFLCMKLPWYRRLYRCTEVLPRLAVFAFAWMLESLLPHPVNHSLQAAFQRQKLPTSRTAALCLPPCWVAKGWDEGESQRSSKTDKGNSSGEEHTLEHSEWRKRQPQITQKNKTGRDWRNGSSSSG